MGTWVLTAGPTLWTPARPGPKESLLGWGLGREGLRPPGTGSGKFHLGPPSPTRTKGLGGQGENSLRDRVGVEGGN